MFVRNATPRRNRIRSRLAVLGCAAALLASARIASAQARADFNGDGFDDLAIGVPFENILLGAPPQVADAGVVHVLYGTASGLDDVGSQYWHQDVPGVLDDVEEGDQFGRTLAAGDFDGDGYGDLAIGAAFEDIGSLASAGVVHVLYGTLLGWALLGFAVGRRGRR